ncbi:hypothetical protein [Metabacillus idriensis]|uniref:hypothetical protein n=1 Tax=Metabacillus idriensis TaxID=324768 RepID=UPI0017482821|nr:hypothetical protein [Metabacillus idriensis]
MSMEFDKEKPLLTSTAENENFIKEETSAEPVASPEELAEEEQIDLLGEKIQSYELMRMMASREDLYRKCRRCLS